MTFEEYVVTRGPALVRFARVLTGDPHRAEDLVQDVLGRAFLRWNRILRADQPDLYLRRAVVNASNSWWRRRSHHEVPTDEPADQPVPRDPGAETVERDAMWRRILRLPERQRAVLVLRYYEDLDDATIAQILDCTSATVRTHAMRALTTLRRQVGPTATISGRQQ